jgi:hypothetical protein
MTKSILFIEDRNADGRQTEIIGTLLSDGTWIGDRKLELDVRRIIRTKDLSLKDPNDRKELLFSFSGSRLYAIEE